MSRTANASMTAIAAMTPFDRPWLRAELVVGNDCTDMVANGRDSEDEVEMILDMTVTLSTRNQDRE